MTLWQPRRDYEEMATKIFKVEYLKKEFNLLSDSTKSILFGLLLGDGSLKINKGYKNARLSFRHSYNVKEYFEWKRDQLKSELSAASDSWEQLPEIAHPNEFGKHKLRYQSAAKPSLTYLFYITHRVGGKFKIERSWLNLMTPLSLAIWWCDDGSLIGSGSQGVFCTDGFTEENVKVLDRYMKKVWGITTEYRPHNKLRVDGGMRYRIYIKTQEDLEKFLKIIIPHIPTLSMMYKVLILYKNPELQQRWISEVAKLSKYSREDLEKICNARKSELKKFN